MSWSDDHRAWSSTISSRSQKRKSSQQTSTSSLCLVSSTQNTETCTLQARNIILSFNLVGWPLVVIMRPLCGLARQRRRWVERSLYLPIPGLDALDSKYRPMMASKWSCINIAAIIMATGLTRFESLSFLVGEEEHNFLDYFTQDAYMPLVLDRSGVLPHIDHKVGFVGSCRGPSWGVMEMQARLLWEEWGRPSNQSTPDTKERGNTTHIRKIKTHRHHHRAQFPMGDYVGYMEELLVNWTSIVENDQVNTSELVQLFLLGMSVTITHPAPRHRAKSQEIGKLDKL